MYTYNVIKCVLFLPRLCSHNAQFPRAHAHFLHTCYFCVPTHISRVLTEHTFHSRTLSTWCAIVFHFKPRVVFFGIALNRRSQWLTLLVIPKTTRRAVYWKYLLVTVSSEIGLKLRIGGNSRWPTWIESFLPFVQDTKLLLWRFMDNISFFTIRFRL